MAMAARKGIPGSLSVQGVEEVRDALKRALAWLAWELRKRCCIQPCEHGTRM